MINKMLACLGLSCLMSASCFAADFSGTYDCKLFDKSDGYFGKATLVLKLNAEASKLNEGYGSYDIDYSVQGIPYSYGGIAAARGNDIALYFESIGAKRDPDDRGVGIASIIVDQDKKGNDHVSLHKFYYEKSYKGASDIGFENCNKA